MLAAIVFATALPAPNGHAPLTLFTQEQMQRTGAQCLDGTPPGYHYLTAGTNDWYFTMDGGGACDAAKCVCGGTGGTSSCWEKQCAMAGTGHCPRGFNYVNIKYCTGDAHSGQGGQKWGYTFTGHLIVQEVVNALKNTSRLGDAQRVIVTGSSAGGESAFLHADWFQEELPNANVFANPVAGAFQPNISSYGTWSASGGAKSTFEDDMAFWNQTNKIDFKSFQPTNCAAKYPPGSALNALCHQVGFYAPMINVPLFMSENQFDPTKPQHTGCGVTSCGVTPEGVRYHALMGRRVAELVDTIIAKPGNGAFIPSCLDHESDFASITLNGKTSSQAFEDWMNGSGPAVYADPCTSDECLPCNADTATCAYPSSAPKPDPPTGACPVGK
jgi:hypothetical protein